MQKNYKKYQKAFSLIEISIALAIIGIMITGVLKGKTLIDQARLQRLIQDIQTYQLATTQFYELYNGLPGDYRFASTRINPGLIDGGGDGSLKEAEAEQAWSHLSGAKLIDKPTVPTFFGGGKVTFVSNPEGLSGLYLKLSRGTQGALTPKQVKTLMDKLGTHSVIVKNGEAAPAPCVENGNLNLLNETPACVVYVDFNI